jgi:hypothetical protein
MSYRKAVVSSASIVCFEALRGRVLPLYAPKAKLAKQGSEPEGTFSHAFASQIHVFYMPTAKVKEEAQRLIEELPDDATWDDLMQRIYVRQAIEAGLEDSEAGRTADVNELRKKLGLSA